VSGVLAARNPVQQQTVVLRGLRSACVMSTGTTKPQNPGSPQRLVALIASWNMTGKRDEHVLRNCGAIYECELNGVSGVAKVARAGLLTACPEHGPPPHVVEQVVGLRSREPEHRRHPVQLVRWASSKQHVEPLDERTPLVLECHCLTGVGVAAEDRGGWRLKGVSPAVMILGDSAEVLTGDRRALVRRLCDLVNAGTCTRLTPRLRLPSISPSHLNSFRAPANG